MSAGQSDSPVPDRAGEEIADYLRSHSATCSDCGLQLAGCTQANCPACGWELKLDVLRERAGPESATPALLPSAVCCHSCGYDLVGLERAVCPECGADLTAASFVYPGDLTTKASPTRGKRTSRAAALFGGVLVMGFIAVFGPATVAIATGSLNPLVLIAIMAVGVIAGVGTGWRLLKAAGKRAGAR